MATGTEANKFIEQAASVIAAAIGGVMKDGHIAAAGRMGIDELGAAFKAFPDAIQVQEPGTIWNTTQGEVASARADEKVSDIGPLEKPRLPSPSEIARETRPYQPPDQDNGQDHGNSR